MEKIAEKCCGSCDHCEKRWTEKGLTFYYYCEKQNAGIEPVTEYYCKTYSPRNPIENKYQKMWEEIADELSLCVRDFENQIPERAEGFKMALRKMNYIQEKHK